VLVIKFDGRRMSRSTDVAMDCTTLSVRASVRYISRDYVNSAGRKRAAILIELLGCLAAGLNTHPQNMDMS
jgi:hypothetical protein